MKLNILKSLDLPCHGVINYFLKIISFTSKVCSNVIDSNHVKIHKKTPSFFDIQKLTYFINKY